MSQTAQVVVDDLPIELSNPDKELFPADDDHPAMTKAEMVAYYRRVADVMLPHLRGRPLTMARCPDGIAGEGFYQKDISGYFPAWVARAEMSKQDGTVHHVVCDDAATLTYLATQACITPHVWLSRRDRPDHPDRLVFDLDPSEPGFEVVRSAALELATVLDDLGLVPFAQVTGSKGVHIVVPLDRSEPFDDVRSFARDVARLLADRHPDLLTVEQRKAKRAGRVSVDTMRNTYAQSMVAPYAVRARPGAPIGTPVDWRELERGDIHPQDYTVRNIFRRLGQRDDPWATLDDQARPLDPARHALDDQEDRNDA